MVLLVALASWATGATYTDPSGDNCKVLSPPTGPVTVCGADITAASGRVNSDGSADLTITDNTANCVVPGVANGPANPEFDIAATTASGLTHIIATIDGSVPWTIRPQTSVAEPTPRIETTPIVVTTKVTAGTTTWDAKLPVAVVAKLQLPFKWLAGDGCAGEIAADNADIIPNRASPLTLNFFTLGGPGPVTAAAATGVATAAAKSLVPISIAKILAGGGVKLTINAPATGAVLASLTAKNGSKTIVLATANARLTHAGKTIITVPLTRGGRTLLKHRKQALSAKLSVTYKSGAVTGRATRGFHIK